MNGWRLSKGPTVTTVTVDGLAAIMHVGETILMDTGKMYTLRTDGLYLINPDIPTKVSAFENDADYTTEHGPFYFDGGEF